MENDHLKIIKNIFSKNSLSQPGDITKFKTGQINRAYEVDGKRVIKFEGELEFARGIFPHQPEILERLLKLGAKVPKVLDVGEVNGKGYILMERVSGRNLIFDWLNFSSEQKEKIIFQLAEQLKIIHSISFSKYRIPIYRQKETENLSEAIEKVTRFSEIKKAKLPLKVLKIIEFLENYYIKNKLVLQEESTAVLVHNDIHLENIYHNGGNLTGIIDWDWACQAPKDYELWRLVDFCRDPKKIINRKGELNYPKYQLAREIKILRKYYPELFSSPNLPVRIRLFLLDTLINVVDDYQKGRWNETVFDDWEEKINDFFKKDWLDNILS